MERFKWALACLATIVLAAGFSACSDNNDEDEVPPPTAPTVSVTAGEATAESLTFTVTSANADEVKWAVMPKDLVESGVFTVTAESVIEGLNSIEANAEVVCTQGNLASETAYLVYAAACKGETYVLSVPVEMTTLASLPEEDEEPYVEVFPLDSTSESLSFMVISENVEEVRWIVVPKDMVDDGFTTVTPESIFGGFGVAEPNAESLCSQEGLMSESAYYVYAAGRQGETYVMSEGVEMSTTASGGGDEPEEIMLAVPVYCSANLTAGLESDCYYFSLSDEADKLYLTFSLYTEAGTNGTIPGNEYEFAEAEAGYIDLAHIDLFHEGKKVEVVEGSLWVETYSDYDGNPIVTLMGAFYSPEACYMLMYDDALQLTGVSSGEEANVREVTFTSAYFNSLDDRNYEVVLSNDNGEALNLILYTYENSTYLGAGQYGVYSSQEEASANNSGMTWCSTASFFQTTFDLGGIMAPLPCNLQPGSDYYVAVETTMGNDPTDPYYGDRYVITTYLKTTPDPVNGEEFIVKASYDGPLGFEVAGQEQMPVLEFYSWYVSMTPGSEAGTYTLDFSGMMIGASFTVRASEIAPSTEEYTYYDIVSGTITEGYMGLNAAPIEAVGQLGVKRLANGADPQDGITKEYYAFLAKDMRVTSGGTTYQIVGDWKSYGAEVK